MKKLLCIFCCLALLATTGCNVFKKENKPEDVGKNYIEEKFSGNEFDTSGLEYAVLEQTDNKAVLKISGTINFTEEIHLIKEDKKWIMASEAEKKEQKTGPQ
jgi:hypothetical protein